MEPLKEVWKSILSWKIWLTIGVEDVLGRYRRTVLGPIWLVVGQLAFILGLYLVHKSVLGGGGGNYLLFLSISLPTWALISQCMVDGCSSLLRSRGYIESYPLPLAIYIIRTLVAAVVTFLHMIPIFIGVAVVQGAPVSPALLAVVPGLAIVLLFCFGIMLILAPLTARFRDVGAGITAAIQLAFVMSPVFWMPTEAQKSSLVVQLNPFYYLLEVVRAPVLNQPLIPEVWGTALAISVVTTIAGLICYRVLRPSIVYWL